LFLENVKGSRVPLDPLMTGTIFLSAAETSLKGGVAVRNWKETE
jgi:hypothetical protein